MSTTVTRADLEKIQGITPRVVRFFTDLFSATTAAVDSASAATSATGSIQDATVITLSTNAAFNNERVLWLDPNFFKTTDSGAGGTYSISLINFIATNGGYRCTFNLKADTSLDMPVTGRVPSSDDGPYADDAAAAAAGIPVGGFYKKTGGTVVWRQV